MGHSNATFEEVIDFPYGKIPHFTHLYNAMSSFNHREVGMLGAGLIMKNSKLELICDMFHINKEAIEIAIKNRGWENIILITDSISATGMSDGVFKLGGLDVEVKSGLCKILGTETIAGSTLTMDKVNKNLKTLNYSLEQLVLGASVDPSRAIEAHDIGLLLPGKKADFITLDRSLQVKETFVDGKEVF